MDHPQTQVYHGYGTAAMARMANNFGVLPTRGFSSGQFEGIEKISGETMRQRLLDRNGKCLPSHACMPGCVIQCSNIYRDEHGEPIVAPLEYETIGLMESNLDIDNLDIISRLNWEVNDLGLDSIEIGAALGVAGFGTATVPHILCELLNARYDWEVGEDILQELGRKTLTLEREFNQRAGFTTADDRLPEWMCEEPLPSHNSVFDVPNEDLDRVFKW